MEYLQAAQIFATLPPEQQKDKSQASTTADEWISLLLKHLQSSTKEENRNLAAKILIAAALHNSYNATTIVTALASSCKPTLAPARVSLYETLETIAANISLQQQQQQQQVEQ
jgi:mannose/cellobiose epimerase-like protein (N-acyl-D-glucosamine 2-epimerase family)